MSLARTQDSLKLASILVLYTGGTFGMETVSKNPLTRETLRVAPMNAAHLRKRVLQQVPELKNLARCQIEILMNKDSAHMRSADWVRMAAFIRERWEDYDGVVILHGTDTLSYTASALSFLLRPCLKPVIITGAQIPLAVHLTDARRNFVSAVEIAAHGPRPLINRVCIFFDDRLFQGNRTRKLSASRFGAFDSPHAEPLAEIGTEIRYPKQSLRSSQGRKPQALKENFSSRIAFLDLTPEFPSSAFEKLLLPPKERDESSLQGLLLQGFPSGTAPTHDPRFLELLRKAKRTQIPVALISENSPQKYEAGRTLLKEGVLWAEKMTPECAFVKMSYLLGQPGITRAQFQALWKKPLAGEF